jgi:hypothetical protein
VKSKQVNFFMLPEDASVFMRQVGDDHDLVFVPSRLSSPNVAEAARLPAALRFTGTNAADGAGSLIRKTDLANVITSHVASRNEWSVDVTRSLAIEFQCGFFDGTVLRRGRAYAVTAYYDERRELRAKDPAFIKSVDATLRSVKRMCRRLNSYYIGPAADEWMKENHGTLNVAGYEIRPEQP